MSELSIPLSAQNINHRNGLSKVFITFPKSGDRDKRIFTEDIINTFSVKSFLTVQEVHEDGEPHFHSYLEFNKKVSKSNLLKYFKLKFPDDFKRIDIKSARSTINCIKYLTEPLKDKIVDSDPYTNINLDLTECTLPDRRFKAYIRGFDSSDYDKEELFDFVFNHWSDQECSSCHKRYLDFRQKKLSEINNSANFLDIDLLEIA